MAAEIRVRVLCSVGRLVTGSSPVSWEAFLRSGLPPPLPDDPARVEGGYEIRTYRCRNRSEKHMLVKPQQNCGFYRCRGCWRVWDSDDDCYSSSSSSSPINSGGGK